MERSRGRNEERREGGRMWGAKEERMGGIGEEDGGFGEEDGENTGKGGRRGRTEEDGGEEGREGEWRVG